MSLPPAGTPSVEEILTSIRRMMSEEMVAPVAKTPPKSSLDINNLKELLPTPHAGRMQGVMDSTAMEALVSRLLRPLLKVWLDENLPALIEKTLHQEMKNIQKTS